MTFAVVLASRSAIWACADRQLTDQHNPLLSSKSGVKITSIETKDGVALLAYAGIGRVKDTQISWWVYRTLRGLNMPLERSLEHISDAAQRRLAPYVRHAGAHFFIAAAIRDGKHYVYEIDLHKRPPQVIRYEPRTRSQVQTGISGSGATYALRYEKPRIRNIARLVKHYEHEKVSSEFIASQLASLNASISARARAVGDNTISPESIVIHRHPKSKKSDGQQWCFDPAGKTYSDPDAAVPIVGCGLPVSEITRALMDDFLQRIRAMPPDATPAQLINAQEYEAATRAIIENIPDTPDEKLR